MESITSAINVQVSAKDKAKDKDLGLNMTTAINMFFYKIIKNYGIPFEARNPKPSRELKNLLISRFIVNY